MPCITATYISCIGQEVYFAKTFKPCNINLFSNFVTFISVFVQLSILKVSPEENFLSEVLGLESPTFA